jgi:hypothetical protein
MGRSVDAIVGYDLDGVVTGWNSGAQRLFGYSAAEMLGSFVTRLVPPADQRTVEDLRRRAVAGERIGPVEGTRIGRDAVFVPVLVTFCPLGQPDGDVVALSELITRISDTADAPPGGRTPPTGKVEFDRRGRHDHYLEAELYQRVREDPAIFDFLQDGSLDGIWYWDLDNPEQEWLSPRFKEVFGYTDDEVPNTAEWWQANIFPEDRDLALDNFEKHCADAKHPYDQIVRYRHKDGSTVWVRCRGLVVRDATGRPKRLLGAHTDVTNIKEAEQALADHAAELEQANQKLADANQLKADLMAMLSHEINQPLCVIRNYSGLLADRWQVLSSEQRQGWLRSLDDGARELSRLVADLLLMFRLDAGAITASRSAVDVRVAVDQAVAGLTGDLDVDVAVDEGFAVAADRGHLRQILVNLLTNAVKYGEPPFEVSAERVGASGRIVVRDHGPGVPDDFVPLLFDRFTRASGAAGLGAGLGLFIVDQLARANGGAIRYEPRGPRGARFLLEVELATSEADRSQPAPQRADGTAPTVAGASAGPARR